MRDNSVCVVVGTHTRTRSALQSYYFGRNGMARYTTFLSFDDFCDQTCWRTTRPSKREKVERWAKDRKKNLKKAASCMVSTKLQENRRTECRQTQTRPNLGVKWSCLPLFSPPPHHQPAPWAASLLHHNPPRAEQEKWLQVKSRKIGKPAKVREARQWPPQPTTQTPMMQRRLDSASEHPNSLTRQSPLSFPLH